MNEARSPTHCSSARLKRCVSAPGSRRNPTNSWNVERMVYTPDATLLIYLVLLIYRAQPKALVARAGGGHDQFPLLHRVHLGPLWSGHQPRDKVTSPTLAVKAWWGLPARRSS